MRVGDRDRPDRAARGDGLDRDLVDERDHVPDHVPLIRLDQEQPLADPDLRLDADTEIAGVLANVGAPLGPQLLERRPVLTVEPDVLALVLADRAAFGRRLALGELRRTGQADRVQGVRR
jgi:hypothetical protein